MDDKSEGSNNGWDIPDISIEKEELDSSKEDVKYYYVSIFTFGTLLSNELKKYEVTDARSSVVTLKIPVDEYQKAMDKTKCNTHISRTLEDSQEFLCMLGESFEGEVDKDNIFEKIEKDEEEEVKVEFRKSGVVLDESGKDKKYIYVTVFHNGEKLSDDLKGYQIVNSSEDHVTLEIPRCDMIKVLNKGYNFKIHKSEEDTKEFLKKFSKYCEKTYRKDIPMEDKNFSEFLETSLTRDKPINGIKGEIEGVSYKLLPTFNEFPWMKNTMYKDYNRLGKLDLLPKIDDDRFKKLFPEVSKNIDLNKSIPKMNINFSSSMVNTADRDVNKELEEEVERRTSKNILKELNKDISKTLGIGASNEYSFSNFESPEVIQSKIDRDSKEFKRLSKVFESGGADVSQLNMPEFDIAKKREISDLPEDFKHNNMVPFYTDKHDTDKFPEYDKRFGLDNKDSITRTLEDNPVPNDTNCGLGMTFVVPQCIRQNENIKVKRTDKDNGRIVIELINNNQGSLKQYNAYFEIYTVNRERYVFINESCIIRLSDLMCVSSVFDYNVQDVRKSNDLRADYGVPEKNTVYVELTNNKRYEIKGITIGLFNKFLQILDTL